MKTGRLVLRMVAGLVATVTALALFFHDQRVMFLGETPVKVRLDGERVEMPGNILDLSDQWGDSDVEYGYADGSSVRIVVHAPFWADDPRDDRSTLLVIRPQSLRGFPRAYVREAKGRPLPEWKP